MNGYSNNQYSKIKYSRFIYKWWHKLSGHYNILAFSDLNLTNKGLLLDSSYQVKLNGDQIMFLRSIDTEIYLKTFLPEKFLKFCNS